MKNYFSNRPDQYIRFKLAYSDELFGMLADIMSEYQIAWDCGTGNGQFARGLSEYFYAIDISELQLMPAIVNNNIVYKTETAEQISFSDNAFSFVSVAQAIYWLHFESFYSEVMRTVMHNNIIAMEGCDCDPIPLNKQTDKIINKLSGIRKESTWKGN